MPSLPLKQKVAIELENNKISFEAGQTIKGNILLNIETDIQAEALMLTLKGYEYISSLEDEKRKMKGLPKFWEVIDSKYELPVVENTFVIRQFNEKNLEQGQYVYPFEISLPLWLPSSMTISTKTMMLSDWTHLSLIYFLRAKLRKNKFFDPTTSNNKDSSNLVSPRSLMLSSDFKQNQSMENTARTFRDMSGDLHSVPEEFGHDHKVPTPFKAEHFAGIDERSHEDSAFATTARLKELKVVDSEEMKIEQDIIHVSDKEDEPEVGDKKSGIKTWWKGA